MSGDVIRYADLQVPVDRTPLTRNFFNSRFLNIVAAMNGVAHRQDVVDVQANDLVTLGLVRINEVLGPFLTTLQEAAQEGFLVAEATGVSHSLTVGVDVSFLITSSGASIFTPTKYILALDETDSTNWGILSLNVWDVEHFLLSAHCIYASKTQASTQWSISAQSAVIQAQLDMLASAVAAANTATTQASTIAGDVATITTLAAAIAAGPVATVAGRTGTVVLAIADISGLTTALADKASVATVTSAVSGKQDSSAKLTSLAAMTWATNKLLMANSSSTISTATVSDFIITLLDDVDAPTALSTLGVSTFIKTLLDDADGPTALSTLGVSTFIKTLLDDADGPTALSTLGVTTFIKTLLDDVDAPTARTTLGVSPALMAVNPQTGTTYTVQTTDNNGLVVLTNASAIALTLPNNAAIGFNVMFKQGGAGAVTTAAQSGGAVFSRGTRLKSNGQYAMWTAVVESNSGGSAAQWMVSGDLIT